MIELLGPILQWDSITDSILIGIVCMPINIEIIGVIGETTATLET